MPPKADSASSKAEQDYINRLAKEFSSIPDREVPPPGSPAGTSILNQGSVSTPGGVVQRNVAIVKTIRTAMSDINK